MECGGCNLVETSPVTLNSGAVVCTTCPAWRLECEARDVLARNKTATERAAWLDDIEKKRGKVAAYQLRAAVKGEWEKNK